TDAPGDLSPAVGPGEQRRALREPDADRAFGGEQPAPIRTDGELDVRVAERREASSLDRVPRVTGDSGVTGPVGGTSGRDSEQDGANGLDRHLVDFGDFDRAQLGDFLVDRGMPSTVAQAHGV